MSICTRMMKNIVYPYKKSGTIITVYHFQISLQRNIFKMIAVSQSPGISFITKCLTFIIVSPLTNFSSFFNLPQFVIRFFQLQFSTSPVSNVSVLTQNQIFVERLHYALKIKSAFVKRKLVIFCRYNLTLFNFLKFLLNSRICLFR